MKQLLDCHRFFTYSEFAVRTNRIIYKHTWRLCIHKSNSTNSINSTHLHCHTISLWYVSVVPSFFLIPMLFQQFDADLIFFSVLQKWCAFRLLMININIFRPNRTLYGRLLTEYIKLIMVAYLIMIPSFLLLDWLLNRCVSWKLADIIFVSNQNPMLFLGVDFAILSWIKTEWLVVTFVETRFILTVCNIWNQKYPSQKTNIIKFMSIVLVVLLYWQISENI